MMRALFGITGWKNSGKTTLVARLVQEFTNRRLTVSALKHAHHSFDIDHQGRDTYKLRKAGARQVAIASPKRWALMHEVGPGAEPSFEEMLSHIGSCDLILVEGYKSGPFPKIEARSRRSKTTTKLSESEPTIIAIAADYDEYDESLPILDINDIGAIADFISDYLSLPPSPHARLED